MGIYERTTKELMHEFAQEKLRPGKRFLRQDAVKWFANKYPKIRANTVSMHVEVMATNSTLRKHHATIRADNDWDLFFKLNRKEFRLWEAETDQAPIYKTTIEVASEAEFEIEDFNNSDDVDPNEELLGSATFAYEKDLENYLVKNLNVLEAGMRLYIDEEGVFDGVQFPVGSRKIDILAVAQDGAYVVIETKVGRAYDKVVGQTLRYMGWVEKNLINSKPVRGIIVSSKITDDLVLATSLVGNVRLIEYEIAFKLKQR